MSDALIVDLATHALLMALLLAAPMLLAALVIGLVVSVFQAVTQIQEQTLSFVPKLVGVAVVFIICLPWLIHTATKYAGELFQALPGLGS
ncbi:MAG TPA: flagellar biosynthesis protein FliQ [Gemmatimonadaceae bacterium]|nr:flagellar biosynthesis protein FliQ [Gemmatimonadaceae bacterium]